MTNQGNKPLILVDGSSYLFRAFHALPPLTNKAGEPTGAIYGVMNMIRKLIKTYEPELMAVVFDAKGKTFRHEMYKEYKAHRPPMPDDLRVQIEPIHQLVKAMGLPLISIEGVEADDVIATLARDAEQAGIPSIISTGDKDLAQLVSNHITLINTMNDSVLDIDGVKTKFGVTPEQMIDYLALVGDSSDNIPGVEKCGPKTAAKWLDEYGSVENLLAHADQIKGKIGENLRNGIEQLKLSQELVTIKQDVPLNTEVSALKLNEPDRPTLAALVTRFEMKNWDDVIGRSVASGATIAQASASKDEQLASASYDIIFEQSVLDGWIEQIKSAGIFSFDTETTSLEYMNAEIVGVSFAVKSGEAAYVPLAHNYPGAPEQLDRDQVLAQLKPILEDANIKKIGQHLKYDRNVLMNYGIEICGIAHDTMLESYVLDSTATRHDMDSLAQYYLDYKTVHFEDIAGKGAKQLQFNDIDLDIAGHYAAEDADITLRLHESIYGRLQQESKLKLVYEEIEIPLVPVLSRMEYTGVLVDRDMLKQQSKELAQRMLEIEQQAYAEAGQPFNLGSPKQLQEILYGKQGIPVTKKTPKGAPSTAEEVLQELAHDYRLPALILEYRSMSKLKSTYADKLPEMINARTGRVHTSYHQAVASTGRLSSSDPNLQNIPIRTEEGRRIRKAFVARPGYKILAADYSQIELRIMAHLSQDKGLLKAFSEGKDIHRATAAEVFGGNPEDVSGEHRRAAKAINFGLIYGMSAFGLARQLNIGRGEAQDYVNLYFERYPGVKTFMDNTREQARAAGYVETVFGRRLYLPEINAKNGQRRQYAERTAINAPMQGTAADIIKRAMIQMDAWIRQEAHEDVIMIMQVHDELVFEVKESLLDQAKEKIISLMNRSASLSVPLEVGAGVGVNWDEAH